MGHPPDRTQAPAFTADRGYSEKAVDDALHDLCLRTVVIPRQGKPGKDRRAAERVPAFRR